MNESDFENQLRTLRPIAPSRSLEEGIARQLASQRSLATVETRVAVIHRDGVEVERVGFFERFFPGLGWALAGAAAAVALTATIHHFGQPAASPALSSTVVSAPDFEPVEVTHDLIATEDGGVIYEDEQEPARLVRYMTLEHHVWTHPVTGARLEVEIPREDIVLVPIAMQ